MNVNMYSPGQIIAERYQIVRFLGRGGMAEVYQVRDRDRVALLAMKLLKAEFTKSDELISLFRNEAQHLDALTHPHIVRFYEFGWDGNDVFFIMDYIDGKTLRKELDDSGGTLPLARIRGVLDSICPALYYAHSENVIHCDLKPANILVDTAGNCFISDFGIAHTAFAAESLYHGNTLIGAGTPAYMAPEQMSTGNLSPSTDIYSLGVLLYEMLTGCKPFWGESAPASISSEYDRIAWEKKHHQPKLPSQINQSIPVGVDRIVMRCLHPDPGLRYHSVIDVMHDFKNVLISNELEQGKKNIERNKDLLEIKQKTYSISSKTKPLVLLGIVAIALVIGIALLGLIVRGAIPEEMAIVQPTQSHESGAGSYDYQSVCMTIEIPDQPQTILQECVDNITVLQDGKLKVFMSWSVSGISSTFGVTVADDSENHNMYLTDDMGNRLDHIETGGGTDETVSLFNGQNKQGWFLFSAPDANSTFYLFHDDDNGKISPLIERRW